MEDKSWAVEKAESWAVEKAVTSVGCSAVMKALLQWFAAQLPATMKVKR